jgi:predicted S18 family serine protease
LQGILPVDPAETGQESAEHFSIAASTWLDMIERVSAAVAFTIPIPIPVISGAHAEGAELLKEARHHLNAGNIDAAIVSARGAMERSEAAAHWPTLGDGNPRSRSVEQRWRAIYQAAMSQTSGAAHEDDVTKDFTYTRREAEALIGIAAALLKAAPGPLDA